MVKFQGLRHVATVAAMFLAGAASAVTLSGSTVFECNSPTNDFFLVEDQATFNARSGCSVNGSDDDGWSVMVRGNGVVNIFAGASLADDLGTEGSGTANIFGGLFDDVILVESSVVYLRGGMIYDILDTQGQSHLFLVGMNWNLPDGDLPAGDTNVVGTLEDGTAFGSPPPP